MRFHRKTILILVTVCLALFGCKKKEEPPVVPVVTPPPVAEVTPAEIPFRVVSIDIGKAIGADNKITAPTMTFGPQDTIYVSVSTEGSSPSATLKSTWTYGAGQAVGDESKTIAPTGPAATEFHASKSDGWPTGKYKVEIWADGVSAGSKEFEVQK